MYDKMISYVLVKCKTVHWRHSHTAPAECYKKDTTDTMMSDGRLKKKKTKCGDPGVWVRKWKAEICLSSASREEAVAHGGRGGDHGECRERGRRSTLAVARTDEIDSGKVGVLVYVGEGAHDRRR